MKELFLFNICLNIKLLSCISDLKTHEDDEYRWAGVEDPKVVITTSHNPSVKLKQFAKVGFYYYYYFIHLICIILLKLCI